LRGLFTGGTMAAEALATLTSQGLQVQSNLKHSGEISRDAHTVIDLGDDEFTRGRPHPMIDPSPRVQQLMAESEDSSVAVVLLDVVLGTGSHEDPAGAMIPSIQHARSRVAQRGGYLPVVASVTGTMGDRQDRARQVAVLERAGVIVMPSNIQATRCAYEILLGGAP